MPNSRTDFFSELAILADCDGFYEAGWRERFTSFVDFSAFQREFLSPLRENTRWMYCPERSRCEYGCPLEVVQEDVGSYYTVCVEGRRPPHRIPVGDIRMLAFNFSAFHRKLAECLPVDPAVEQVGDTLSWQLGTLRYGCGTRRRMYITYVSPHELPGEIIRLSVSDTIPMIVFTPYRFALRRDDSLMLRVVDVVILPVNEMMTIDRDCRLFPAPDFSRQIRALLKESDKSVEPTGMPVPAGIEWEDIRLRFLDAHTVSCRINKTIMTLSYHDLGMVNRKNGKPDKNWLYLLQFAVHGGTLRVDWQNPNRAPREQQRKRRLSQALQAFFHIDSEPIVFDRELFSYVCRFPLKPETEVTRYRAPLK